MALCISSREGSLVPSPHIPAANWQDPSNWGWWMQIHCSWSEPYHSLMANFVHTRLCSVIFGLAPLLLMCIVDHYPMHVWTRCAERWGLESQGALHFLSFQRLLSCHVALMVMVTMRCSRLHFVFVSVSLSYTLIDLLNYSDFDVSWNWLWFADSSHSRWGSEAVSSREAMPNDLRYVDR